MNRFKRWLSAPPALCARRWCSDRTLGLEEEEAAVLTSIQRVPCRSLYGDRFAELREFWGVGYVRCMWFFMRKGFPFSKTIRKRLMDEFEGQTHPGALLESYRRTAFHYAAYLMLSMHRGQWLAPFVPEILRRFGKMQGVRILDYGCGVSDAGLILARMGADMTVADLDTPRLNFARWRYAVRGMHCAVLAIDDTERNPALPPAGFDLVVATEVLEHVRDPLALLQAFTQTLTPGGLLVCTSGAALEREVGGDHLAEAIEAGNGAEYRRYFLAHFAACEVVEGRVWLFYRKPATLPE